MLKTFQPGVAVAHPAHQTGEQARPGARRGGFEQQRAQRRRQGQRIDRGQHHRHADRHRELLVQRPGDAGHERNREEHRQQHQGGRDHRPGHLPHRLPGRGPRLLPGLRHHALHVLHHHDAVVHHHPDGQDGREQGDHVGREAQRVERRVGADERDRDGERRDEGRAPVAEEEEGDRDDQDEGDEQGLDDLPHGGAHGLRGVVEDLVFDVRGEALGEGCEPRMDGVGHGERVGAGGLVERDHGRRSVVELGDCVVDLRAQLDPGYVPQPHEGAVRVGPHDDVGELLDAREPPPGPDRVLELRGVVE